MVRFGLEFDHTLPLTSMVSYPPASLLACISSLRRTTEVDASSPPQKERAVMFVAKPSTLALSVLALGPANTAPRGGGGVEAFVVPSNVGRNIGRLEGGSYVDDGGRRGKGSQQRRPRQRHQEQRMCVKGNDICNESAERGECCSLLL